MEDRKKALLHVEALILLLRGVGVDRMMTYHDDPIFLGILQDKKPIAIRVPSNGVVHASETVDAEYGYEAKYKVMHQGEKVAVMSSTSPRNPAARPVSTLCG